MSESPLIAVHNFFSFEAMSYSNKPFSKAEKTVDSDAAIAIALLVAE